MTTVAGNYVSCPADSRYSGDNDPATSACLNYPFVVAVAPSGDIYIGDTYNCVIRKVTQCALPTQ